MAFAKTSISKESLTTPTYVLSKEIEIRRGTAWPIVKKFPVNVESRHSFASMARDHWPSIIYIDTMPLALREEPWNLAKKKKGFVMSRMTGIENGIMGSANSEINTFLTCFVHFIWKSTFLLAGTPNSPHPQNDFEGHIWVHWLSPCNQTSYFQCFSDNFKTNLLCSDIFIW